MPATFEPISSTVLESNTTSVTLSGFPSTYTDLRLVCFVNSTTGQDFDMRFNGDSGSNYYNQGSRNGNGSYSTASTLTSYIRCTWIGSLPTETNIRGMAIFDIMSYSNTSWHKNVHQTWSNQRTTSVGSGELNVQLGSWRNTAAITSISFSGATFLAGSTFTLFGIKGAS